MTKTVDIAVYCIGLAMAAVVWVASASAQVMAHAEACLRTVLLVGGPLLGIGLLPSAARVREQRGRA